MTKMNATPFRLLREVARGPGSRVYLAQPRTGPPVALKCLEGVGAPSIARLRVLRARAQALDAERHRNVLLPQAAVTVDDTPALVTPWVEGADLVDWLALISEGQPKPTARVVLGVVRAVVTSLQSIIERDQSGLHGDIKPSNIMVDRWGSVFVLDTELGFTTRGGESAAAAALQLGLTAWLSPERRAGAHASQAADIYALGIIALELLQGAPFRRLSAKNPSHDRHLSEAVALADEALGIGVTGHRTAQLLLSMASWSPADRPTSRDVLARCHALLSDLPGPDIDAWAHLHLSPWIDAPSSTPDPALRWQGTVRPLRDTSAGGPTPPPALAPIVGRPLDIDASSLQFVGADPLGATLSDFGSPQLDFPSAPKLIPTDNTQASTPRQASPTSSAPPPSYLPVAAGVAIALAAIVSAWALV